MSMAALLDGVHSHIKTALTLTDDHVAVSFNGQPPPFSGQYFITVHPGEVINGQDEMREDYYSVYVTVTYRTPYAPLDRQGQDVIRKTSENIYKTCDAIAAAIHGKYAHITVANALISDLQNKFIEPLRFRGYSGLEERASDWFWSDDDGTRLGERKSISLNLSNSGFSVTISFADACRIQTLADQA